MQVILMEKVANLGQLGEVVKVRSGFARNYLIPQKKAKRATPENLAEFEARRGELERAQADALNQARARAEKIDGFSLKVTRKAGVDGKLFGSVTNFDVVDELKNQGVGVERSEIRMPAGPIKQAGEHPISLVLHPDVIATITVSVQAET